MCAMWGADPDELDSLAGRMSQGATLLDGIRSQLSAALGAVPWHGPESDQYRQQWQASSVPSLARATDFLQSNATVLRNAAQKQRVASEAAGGGTGSGGGRGGPGMGLPPLIGLQLFDLGKVGQWLLKNGIPWTPAGVDLARQLLTWATNPFEKTTREWFPGIVTFMKGAANDPFWGPIVRSDPMRWISRFSGPLDRFLGPVGIAVSAASLGIDGFNTIQSFRQGGFDHKTVNDGLSTLADGFYTATAITALCPPPIDVVGAPICLAAGLGINAGQWIANADPQLGQQFIHGAQIVGGTVVAGVGDAVHGAQIVGGTVAAGAGDAMRGAQVVSGAVSGAVNQGVQDASRGAQAVGGAVSGAAQGAENWVGSLF